MLVCEQHWNGTDESIHEVIIEDGSISPEYHNMICSVSMTSGGKIGDSNICKNRGRTSRGRIFPLLNLKQKLRIYLYYQN